MSFNFIQSRVARYSKEINLFSKLSLMNIDGACWWDGPAGWPREPAGGVSPRRQGAGGDGGWPSWEQLRARRRGSS